MMKTIRVAIVDDEPLAQEILETYLAKLPGFVLVGKCKNALEAFSLLNREAVDMMLLDINMPEITGMDFLKTLRNPPLVIFTTAYPQFALESYELDAVDYLLKPIAFDRFMKAMNKARDIMQASVKHTEPVAAPASAPAPAAPDNVMFVKSEGKLVKIDLPSLWLVEGLKDYIRLWTEQGKLIVHSTMKNMEEQLASLPYFVRVNKSYIVNLRHITEVDGNIIRVKSENITIGNTYREEVHRLFNQYKLL